MDLLDTQCWPLVDPTNQNGGMTLYFNQNGGTTLYSSICDQVPHPLQHLPSSDLQIVSNSVCTVMPHLNCGLYFDMAYT